MFSPRKTGRVLYAVTLGALLVSLSSGASAQPAGFDNAAFERVWQRTDLPVARGDVARTWFWGPEPGSRRSEPFGAGTRQVQYFDKARMEINDPTADQRSPWYVTNGLLTVELIAGEYEGMTQPGGTPDIPLASDLDDPNAPTYRSFRAVADVPGSSSHQVSSAAGKPATATINRAGQVGNDPSKGALGEAVRYAHFEPSTRHNVVGAFWDFLNSVDLVYEGGQTKLRLLSDPWFYATGYPISEAYWARVKIAGAMRDVLIQAFQRRVLTYVPDNPPGWRVQMGNIGDHYYQWRYGSPGPAATPLPTPSGRIAFSSDRGGGGLAIFTMNPDGTDLRKVAYTPGDNLAPRFGASAGAIVYYNVPAGQGKAELESARLNSASRIMFAAEGQAGEGTPLGATRVQRWEGQADPSYSPTGIFLAFRGKPAGEEPGIFVANMASDAPFIPVQRLTTGAWDRQPAWSPDGRQIAYTSGNGPEESQIWLVNADGTGSSRLTDVVSRQRDQDPAWRPDGKALAFASNRNTSKLDLFIVETNGTLRNALTSGEAADHRHPSFSPDGRWLAFSSNREGTLDIYVAPADLSRWTGVARAPGIDAQPSWGK